MTGLTLRAMCVEDGPDDALPLVGGSDTTGTVYELDQASLYTDDGTTITGQIFSPEHTEGDPLRQKLWPGFTFGYLKNSNGQLQVDIVTDAGAARVSKTFSWTVAAALWDVAQWDVDSWGG